MTLHPVIVAIPQVAPPRSPRQVREQRECARMALRCCANRCGAPDDGWAKDANDVPLPNRGFFWSVSHKRQWAVAVIADRPVGIDIEHIAPRPRELHDALAVTEEWLILGDRSWHSFFRLWTAKEAVLKANGVGIAEFLHCRLVELCDEHHMVLEHGGKLSRIEHFHHSDHLAAVTSDSTDVNWRVLCET